MSDSKFNFTIDKIEALPPASKKRNEFYRDSKIDGLYLRVSDTGVKSFLIRKWRVDGMKEKTLGRFNPSATQASDFESDPLSVIGNNPSFNVEQARRVARAYLAELSTGGDPLEAITKAKAELTLGELFNEYLTRHAQKSCKTAKDMERNFERYAASLRNVKLSRITQAMADKLHGELGESRGEYTANRTVQLLKAVYNMGKARKLYFGDNPFGGITLFKEKPRERFLSNEEVGRLLKVLKEEGDDLIRDFIALAIFTGARKANLCSMRFDEINFDAGTWTIPDTKNGTSQTISLGGSELAILHRRLGKASSAYVFPGSGKTGHLIDPKKSWVRIRKEAGIADCTIHDLRRSLGAGLANTGANLALIKSALHHKDMKTTINVYARTRQDAVHQAKQVVHQQWLEAAGLAGAKTKARTRPAMK